MAMICSGCGGTLAAGARPFRCRNAGGDDVDHVLARRVELASEPFFDSEADPFVRFRKLTHAWQDAMACGVRDGEFVDVVRGLGDRIEAVDGRRFAITPFAPREDLGVWVKDETSNVAGSHKARHLMGVLIWLEVMARFDSALAEAPLAIASCGNAALAAAVLARAAGRVLDVYVPEEADAEVVECIASLGARVTRCERRDGVAGDPSVVRFREAVAQGALPFTCQGNENGLVIEGGSTLGWEMVSQNPRTERIFIQTGGGALASAVIAAYEDALALGLIERMPRVYAVQTMASPLARAWEKLVQAPHPDPLPTAVRLRRGEGNELGYAIGHRSEFMWPWETTPSSVASGIVDDETYDWAAIVRGMLASGGEPVVVSEERLIEANRLAGDGVSATGSAGLAGVLARPGGEATAVLFTGCRR
jgi:threonine synthase